MQAKTDILQIKNSIKSEINMRQEKLLSLWSDLENTENALYALEMDCKLLSKEYREAIEKADQAASFIKRRPIGLRSAQRKIFLNTKLGLEMLFSSLNKQNLLWKV